MAVVVTGVVVVVVVVVVIDVVMTTRRNRSLLAQRPPQMPECPRLCAWLIACRRTRGIMPWGCTLMCIQVNLPSLAELAVPSSMLLQSRRQRPRTQRPSASCASVLRESQNRHRRARGRHTLPPDRPL